ncbi:MAG: NAD(P)-dependent oxidoreductase [Methylohalobius sp.]|nr:NAD(P)-dependent oxidoreductase [Methylohalobius sp.]
MGFIGLGVMGAAMARNLAKAGLLQVVWNRTSNKAHSLAEELKVKAAASPSELAKECQIIALCVSADPDVLEVIDALLPGIQPGAVVIDHSTVSPQTAKLAAVKLIQVGAEFLDAPVSGGVEGARAGTLVAMVGGSQEALAKAKPALEAVASTIVPIGPVGSGQATKAVNQVLCAGINQAVCEALAFAEALGLDLDQVIEVLTRGAAGNWFLEKRGRTMVRGQFQPGFKLGLHYKDLKICLAMAEQIALPLQLAAQTLGDYEQLIAQGLSEEDISALYRFKRPA